MPAFWLLFTIPGRIICNSEAVKRCIVSYGIDASKIVAIPAFSSQYLEYADAVLPEPVERFFGRYAAIVFTYIRMRPLFYPLTLFKGMATVIRSQPHVGLVVCGGTSHADAGVWPAVQAEIAREGIADHICFVDDVDHDQFLAALRRSALYLRTPITDGVASSVLEALALRIPVVGSENGTRPEGVITYPADDDVRMAEAVEYVIANRAAVVASIPPVAVADTVADEVALLTS